MMNYLEKKYGRNIVSQKYVPERKSETIKLTRKTLYLFLIVWMILGFAVGSITTVVIIKSVEVQCEDTLKGGG